MLTLPAPQPPWPGLPRRIETKVRKALHEFQLLEGATGIAVALSGGKDSLTLLFMLKAILGRGFPPLKLVAIHIDGAYTCGAGVGSSFTHGICKKLDIPLITRESTRTLDELECYSCSRERRRLIFDAAKEADCSHIAFGHHRDDNAQTLLMNLMQKGEFAGMLPKLEMVHFGVTIVRPLIYVSEEEIKNFAKESGFMRITCQCPVGQNSKRKEVEKLLSEMEGIYPNARQNLSSASLLFGSEKARTP